MEIIQETLKDTILIIPLLFIMYFFLESLERRQQTQHFESYLKKFGPLFGSLVGLIPQCGFSVLASMLFIEKKITWGTLISVLIATSDEAIPILLTHPQMYSSLLSILFFKFIIAIIVGYLVDFFLKEQQFSTSTVTEHHEHGHPLMIEVFLRTMKIYLFIFVVQIILTYFMEQLTPHQISFLFMDESLFQPIICALFGFVPNCASSVILSQLYVNSIISFSSLLSGLITNGGLGILILLQNKVKSSVILKTCLIILLTALIITIPFQWFHLM